MNAPSALPGFTVSGLAEHLSRQIFHVRDAVVQDPADEPPITLLDHYARSRWAGAQLDDDVNVRIRRDGERTASEGPGALAAQAGAAVDALRIALPAQPAGRLVHLPWAPWSLTLENFLITRMLEITVHCDDLAYSVGVETPPQPPEAIAAVVTLLAQLAVPPARTERGPACPQPGRTCARHHRRDLTGRPGPRNPWYTGLGIIV